MVSLYMSVVVACCSFLSRPLLRAQTVIPVLESQSSEELKMPQAYTNTEATLLVQPGFCLQFMATEERRARYWARSFAGWHEFAAVQPNRAHYALAQMQRMGWAQDIITQNVDRLHHKAGSTDIIELHGTTHR